jgi:23S rRNA pseudouridine2457 synthase
MSRSLAFYKPYEVLSQFTDAQGRRTLQEFIPIKNVYAAGRLDYRSEGLLLLSDDGALIQKLTDPRFNHTKTYYAQVEGVVHPQVIERLRTEIVLPELQTRLPQVELIPDPELPPRPVPVRDYHPTSWIKIQLQEGKKHQVRRMTAAVGFPTLRLVRLAIGPVNLGSLQPGEWRDLTAAELLSLANTANKHHRSSRRTTGGSF